jgi:hypothetical protein
MLITDPLCSSRFSDELWPCWDDYSVTPLVVRKCALGSCLVCMAEAEDDEGCAGESTASTAVTAPLWSSRAWPGSPSLSFETSR